MVNYNFCEEIFILPLILILLVNINIVIQFDAWVCHFVMLCVCTQYFSCSNCYNYHRHETAGHQVKGKARDSPWSNVISIVWTFFFFFFQKCYHENGLNCAVWFSGFWVVQILHKIMVVTGDRAPTRASDGEDNSVWCRMGPLVKQEREHLVGCSSVFPLNWD